MSELTRLHWQCRRGSLELDLLVQHYLQMHDVINNEIERARFAELLILDDAELMQVLMREFLIID